MDLSACTVDRFTAFVSADVAHVRSQLFSTAVDYNKATVVCLCLIAVVPSVCSADPKGPATGSQGIRGSISVISSSTFT